MRITADQKKTVDGDKRRRKAEIKEQRAKSKAFVGKLGIKGVKPQSHIDAYTQEFKELIHKLNDQNINYHTQDDKSGKLDPFTLGEKQAVSNILSGNLGPGDERRGKLKTKLYDESQKYYQNNLCVCTNGLSLLSLNSLEAHSAVHQLQC